MIWTSHLFVKWRAGLLACLAGSALLAGCATGQDFSADAVASLQPGRTTMSDAIQILQGMPQQVMPQSDGSTIALWAYKMSVVTDAIYYRREATLQFAPDGRLARVLDTTNVPLSGATRQKLLGAASIPQETQVPPAGAVESASPDAGAAAPPGVTASPVPAL
jgi:hypothetical protein